MRRFSYLELQGEPSLVQWPQEQTVSPSLRRSN
jgi:hypothetical protein